MLYQDPVESPLLLANSIAFRMLLTGMFYRSLYRRMPQKLDEAGRLPYGGDRLNLVKLVVSHSWETI
ncbi:hypothetical protein VAE151_130007 [Vibrio aestuarianus]|nr:hypothetical protein VAE151_130007 [Vibrio aestuarianus]